MWAAGLGLSAIYFGVAGDGAAWPRASVAVLGGLWSARLAVHLWTRVRNAPEDGRYQNLRAHWNGSQIKFFLFFQFQALLIVLFSLPFLAVARASRGFGAPMLIGIAIWLFSVIGESIADRQLARFRADPANRGRTCREGLWRYSRHPNYFFEWLHWFAYVGLAANSPLAWLAWSGPAGHVRVLALDQRNSIRGSAGAAKPRRGLPSLSTQHFDADSLVSEKDRAMNIAVTELHELPKERPAAGMLGLAERGWLPDALLRHGIRRLCAPAAAEEAAGGAQAQAARFSERIEMLRHSPVAIHTDGANAQHYELPPAFFKLCLGTALEVLGLPTTQAAASRSKRPKRPCWNCTADRAELADGQESSSSAAAGVR